MLNDSHKNKLHAIVNTSTNQALLERLEMLLLAMGLDTENKLGEGLVKDTQEAYQTSLKSRLRKLIDSNLSDEDLELVRLNIEPEFEGKGFWDELTDIERKRLRTSLEQSKDPAILIPHEQVMEMMKSWSQGR